MARTRHDMSRIRSISPPLEKSENQGNSYELLLRLVFQSTTKFSDVEYLLSHVYEMDCLEALPQST